MYRLFILLLTLGWVFLPVSYTHAQGAPAAAEAVAKVPARPDYSKKESWARLPEKLDKPADVFYVYPTVFREKSSAVENMDIQNAALRRLADVQIGINEGVFSPSANVYAPYYRQASIGILNAPENAQQDYLSPGYQDVVQAFDYYLMHYNKGRPFILAGFSQGSMALLNLMKKRFNEPALQKKLVAAYLIGCSVTKSDINRYPWLKMAQGETDTGGIISYNTQLPGSGYSYVLRPGAQSINPVNWRTDRRMAQKKEHKGAVIFDIRTGKRTEKIPNFTSAYIEKDTRALVVNADPKIYSINQPLFPDGVLHMYDYMFFYNNLTDNAAKRVSAWKEAK